MSPFLEQQRESLGRALRRHVAGEVRFDRPARRLYATDASIYQIEPFGVVVPKTADDVAVVMQLCAEARVSITPRGGGTSLSGQAIGPGVVVDCSKYLNNVLDLDAGAKKATVQPGVVLDTFNRLLGEHDLQFGPDVSTSSRANLGGMIGNNSAGSRSIVYGKTIEHVHKLTAVLSDGSRATFGMLDARGWDQKAALPTLEGAVYRQARQLGLQHRDEIVRRF